MNTTTTPRQDPHDPKAERALVGAMLISREAADRSLAVVRTDDLYDPICRTIFAAVAALRARQAGVDVVTVDALLKERGHLDRVGGFVGLTEFAEHVTTGAHAPYHARIVRDLAVRRRVIEAAEHIASDGRGHVEDTQAFLVEAQRRMFGTIEAEAGFGAEGSLAEDVQHVAEAFEASADAATVDCVPTGFRALDAAVGGFERGRLSVIAARPGMGKSSWLLRLVRTLATAGWKVLMFAIEEDRRTIIERWVSQDTRIPRNNLRLRHLDDEQRARAGASARAIAQVPLEVVQRRPIGGDELRARARAISQRMGGLDLVVVDHLTVMREPGQWYGATHARITQSLEHLCACAKELGAPVVAAAQLSRELERRPPGARRPVLSDLRESGSIEELARFVGFLYRPAYYDRTADVHAAELHVAKMNDGPQDTTVSLWFDAATVRWEDAPDGRQGEMPV